MQHWSTPATGAPERDPAMSERSEHLTVQTGSGTAPDQPCLSDGPHLQQRAHTKPKQPSGVKQLLKNDLGTVCSKAQNALQTAHVEKLNILLSLKSSTPFVILEIQTLCKALKHKCLPTSKTYIILSLTNLLY